MKKIEKVDIGSLTLEIDFKQQQKNLLEVFNALSALLNENEDAVDIAIRHELETRMRHLQNVIAVFISLYDYEGNPPMDNSRLLPCEFLDT